MRAGESSDDLAQLLRRGEDTSAKLLPAGDHVGQRILLADCDPQANASEMFIPEPEIEFDIRSIIADQVPH